MMDERGVERGVAGGSIVLASTVRRRSPRSSVQQEPVFLPDRAAFEQRFPAWPADGRTVTQEAWAALPLIASTGKPLGAVALGFDERRVFER
jgi:hypothetical protein